MLLIGEMSPKVGNFLSLLWKIRGFGHPCVAAFRVFRWFWESAVEEKTLLLPRFFRNRISLDGGQAWAKEMYV